MTENTDEITGSLEHENAYGYQDIKKPDKQQITLQLIIKRNLGDIRTRRSAVDRSQQTDMHAQNIIQLTHIHLDRENINIIDNLAEFLGPVTNLYLQHNIIEKIENLEFLSKLKVLLLSYNKISTIENLKPLNNLQYLDLSFNQIESFDKNELPKSLIIFDIRGNKCVDSNENWEKQSEDLVKYLPKLTQLNGEELYDLVKSDDEDDDDDGMTADKIDFIKDESKDTFIKMHDLTVKIVQRSKQRQKQFEISSTKQFEQMKNELEMSNSNLLEKLKSMRNSINYESIDFDS